MNIICENLTKIYRQGSHDDVIAVNSCNFQIEQQQIVVILGVSGTGKSTLLRLLGLQEYPTSGKIRFDALDVTSLRESERSRMRTSEIGYVHQNYNLIPLMSAEENILLPRYIAGKSRDKSDLAKLSELLQIHHKLHYFPSSLSGGQQQRVAIARALINHPKLVLADEPTGNLDHMTKYDVIKLFSQIRDEYQATVVIVTHDQSFVDIADRVYMMENGSLQQMSALQ